jgi:hypothetical protein
MVWKSLHGGKAFMCFLKQLGFHDHAAIGIIQARATCSEQSPRSTGLEAEVIGSNRQ